MKIKNKKDFCAGLMFAFFGIFFVYFGQPYAFGSAAKMGPGYFPQMIGGILTCLGVAIVLSSMSRKARAEEVKPGSWKVLCQILLPVIFFAIFLNSLGLIVCQFMLVALACLACKEFKWYEILMLATFLVCLSYGVFVLALQLQFPLWPVFFTR